jgi:uncharacterized protein
MVDRGASRSAARARSASPRVEERTNERTNAKTALATMTSVIDHAEAYVREELAQNDGSHDYWHIDRVRANAMALAREESTTNEGVVDEEVVELAALLHDVKDWKYAGGDANAGRDAVRAFLSSVAYDEAKMEKICAIVRYVGFKSELAGEGDDAYARATNSIEFKIVQDADRLDAIGAIGIARTFTFGGARNNPMHVPGVEPERALTAEAYAKNQTSADRPNTTINHFHEKLFKLRDKMKTNAGRRRAMARHDVMVRFVEQFHREWDGEA